MRFDVGFAVLRGHFPAFEGVDAIYSPRRTATARLVIGADGKRSLQAGAVDAPAYRAKPPLSMAYYTYWEGVDCGSTDRPGATNDGMVMTYVGWPVEEFKAFRSDVEGNFLRTLDLAGDLRERVRTGSTPFNEYFSPANLLRVIGLRAMAGLMLGKLFSGRTRARVAMP